MHTLQPKHTKLTKEECSELLKKFNISLLQLPQIKKNDAALQGAECAQGDIIKIERKEGKEKGIYYRVIV